MSIAIRSISEIAIGELPAVLDASVPSPFAALLEDPEARIIYIIELYPYSEEKANTGSFPAPISSVAIGEFDFKYVGGVESIYISDAGYLTKPTDSPANTSYLPLTDNPFQFDVSILNGNEFRGGAPSFGSVRIKNGDKELDALMGYYWGGRSVKVYAGSPDFTRSQFVKIFDGLAQSVEGDEDEIIINLSDKQSILESNFEQNLYEGSGGLDGGEELAGKPKPLVYGACKNVPLTLVDSANLIYQVHDGSIEAVTKVFDRGVELTNEGDVADITGESVSASSFKTQLSGGYIKLGSNPDGRITANVQGDNTGGYVDEIGSITSRLLKTKLDLSNFSDEEIDQGALNAIDQSINSSLGFYTQDSTNLKAVIDALFVPAQCYWAFSRLGEFTGGVLGSPSSPSLTLTADNIEDDSFEVLNVIPPAWRVSIEYDRSWLVQNEDDMASGAATAQKDFAKQQYRKITTENRIVRGKTTNAYEVSFSTLIDSETDALAQIARFEQMYRSQRQVIRIKALKLLFRVFIGDVITLTLDRYGYESGKDFIITNVSEDIETASTTLELWG